MNKCEILKYIESEKKIYTDDYLKLDIIIEPLVNYFNLIDFFTLSSCGSHLDNEDDKSTTHRAYVSFCISQEDFERYNNLKEKIYNFIKDYQNKYCQSIVDWIYPEMICDVHFDCDKEFNGIKDFNNLNSIHNSIYRKWNYEKINNKLFKLYWEKNPYEKDSLWVLVKKEMIDKNNPLKDCLNIYFGLDESYERRYHFFQEFYKFLDIKYNVEDIVLEEKRCLKEKGIPIKK